MRNRHHCHYVQRVSIRSLTLPCLHLRGAKVPPPSTCTSQRSTSLPFYFTVALKTSRVTSETPHISTDPSSAAVSPPIHWNDGSSCRTAVAAGESFHQCPSKEPSLIYSINIHLRGRLSLKAFHYSMCVYIQICIFMFDTDTFALNQPILVFFTQSSISDVFYFFICDFMRGGNC